MKIKVLTGIIALIIMAGVVGWRKDALFSPPQEVLSILELRPERNEIYPGDVIFISAVIEHKGFIRPNRPTEWIGNGCSPTPPSTTSEVRCCDGWMLG
ncbi:hypothetical protein J7M22_08275 [Candidatus Poribacteria bacterium]|nr:hypothetical protein [Candidatus Poribacteria bacterium]